MSLFQENPAEINQLESFVYESNHLNQETEVEVEKLVNLLVDLKIMRQDKYSNELIDDDSKTLNLAPEIPQEDIDIDDSNVEVEKQEDLPTAIPATEEPIEQLILSPEVTHKLEESKPSGSLLEYYDENIEELYDAYKGLQVLLLAPELGELEN
ncbi:MAG: hypothetical protein WBV73_19475, partial [Phormidium sp.]